MKRLILIGRSEAGKSTLIRALLGMTVKAKKTQAVSFEDWVIDTPGEYAETQRLGGALAIYSCEADVIGLLCSAAEPYSLFPPNITGMATRPVIGIVTKCDHPAARRDLARLWLENAGCRKLFFTSSRSGEGIGELRRFLAGDFLVNPHETTKIS